MKYENKIDLDLVTISSGSSKKITMNWENSDGGEWLVGVMVNVTDTKRDPDLSNNRMLLETTLKIKSIERNPPSISDIDIDPDSLEQGETVKISAEVTDDTGLETVTINISNPDNESTEDSMVRSTDNVFSYTFKNTEEKGIYSFVIKAVDISIYSNTATYSSTFYVDEDSTDPEILYTGVNPDVQLVDKKVEIFCIATDNIGISSVKLTITTPSGGSISETMDYSSSTGKYVYKIDFETPGKYKYKVKVYDKANNWDDSDAEVFWITTNLDDRDNDGMPDWWEEKYGFNPEDPSDAENDEDNDGYTNLREYELRFNPRKDIFMQNTVQRINDNIIYLVVSIIAFIVIVILVIMGKRRIFV
jgi:hypothetical protein